MVGMPVSLGNFGTPFMLLPIGTRRQPAKLRGQIGEVQRLAWGWAGSKVGEVPEVLIFSDDRGVLALWDGNDYHSVNQKVRHEIEAALISYDPCADPFGRRDRNKKALSVDLKDWRKRLAWTTERAGEELGMSARTIEGIEQGRGFAFEKLIRIAMRVFEKQSGGNG